MEENSKFEVSQDFLKFLFDQTPRTPELFIDLKKNGALNLPSISFEEEEELHTRRITEVYSAEIAASESKIASAKIDDDKHQTLNLTLPVIEGHKETEVSKLQTEADSSPLLIILDANSTDESSSISFEKEELHKRHQTEEIKAAKTKIDSPKIDKDKHHTLKFTLEPSRGKKKTDVSKLKTKAASDPENPVLHIESMPESGFLQQRNVEQKAMHARIQKDVFKSITSSKPQIKISNGKRKFETCNNKSEISSLLPRPNVVKFEISSEGWKKAPLTELQSEEMQISFSSKFQESLKNKTCKNSSSSDIFCRKWRAIKPKSPNEQCQTLTKYLQTKSKEDQKFMPLKVTNKRHQAEEISQLRKESCRKAANSNSSNKLCKASLYEESKMNQDEISESLVMQSEAFQNVLPSDSSKMEDKNYKNTRSSLLKNKTCINAFSSGMCEKDRLLKKSLNLLNEPCQIIEGSSQTKSKEDRMLIQAKKRYLTGEFPQLQKKLCHKAAMFELQNEMCKTPLVEQLKINQDQISESLVMQNEDFQNVFLSDSSKMKDKNYKNARSSLSKNKTCINASSSGMCEKDFLLKRSLNLPNEPCQIIEGSSQTKSKEDRMLMQAKKRFLTGEISQLKKKLCHNASMFELQNEMGKKPFVEQLKINQDQISESLVMQNEDFQNVFLSDSSKMKDKNYNNTRSSLSKNKTCKNVSSSSMCDKDCQVIKPLNPPNTPCQNLEEYPQTKSKENEKFILAKKRYLTGEIPQLQKKLCHEATTFEPKNEMRKTPLDEQLKTNKDQTSESFVLQSEGFFLSANSSKIQGENYKIAESPLLENKACKNDSSSSVCEKCCQAIKPSNPPDEKLQTSKKTSQTKSKEEQSAMPSELIKKQHQTEEISQLQMKLYQKATISKSQNKLYKIALTQRPEMNHDQISIMQTEDVKSIFPSDTSKMENENSKNAESLLLKNEICKNATLLRMHEKKLQAIKPPNLPNESYPTLEKSPETKSTEDQAIKLPNLTNESYQTLEKPPQTKTTGTEDQAIKPLNLPNESYQTLEKSPQIKSAEDQMGVSLKLANKRHREEEVSQLQKKLGLKATIFEPQNKICKTSSIEQPHINQDQVSESLIMQSEGFKNVLLLDSSAKVSEHGLSSEFNHERAQTTKQVLMKNVACQTEEEFLESHIKKDITTVFTNVQNEKIQVVKHLALNAKQNRKRSPKPDVLPNTNIMLSRCLFKKAPISEFIKQNCQAFADRKLQNKSLPTHSPTEIQTEEAETEIQPFIKNVKNRRNTPQLQSKTSQVSKVLEPQNKQCLIEIASSSQNEMDQATTSLERQNKFISQQFVFSSSTQNKNAQSVSSSELQEEKCEIIEQKDFSNEKIQEAVSNQVTVKQTSSEMINEICLCKINCDTPVSSGNTAHCTNISPLSALHGFVENVNPPGNFQNICTGFITSQVYNIRQSAPAMLDHEVPHSSLIISENHFDSCENHANLERVNLNTNNYVIANQIAYPIVCANINITSFHNTDTSMLMHPYSYVSHDIFFNPVCTALINPSGFINNYCHFGGLLLSKENCANVCLSCTNICNVCKPSASSTDLNESKRS